jgi:hypothetical protein
MLFKSAHPDIDCKSNPQDPIANEGQPGSIVPSDLTVWEWLFESKKHSPIYNFPSDQLSGYTNAITKERVNWAQVKECATYLSTALVKKYGMQAGHTVLLFSQNTIWYPVTQLAAIRAGGCSSLLCCYPFCSNALSGLRLLIAVHLISLLYICHVFLLSFASEDCIAHISLR